MDHCKKRVFCLCFFVLAVCSSSLVQSFSVVMEPYGGFKEYTDVFFTGTVVSLLCKVSGIDVDDANVSVYFNDMLIAMNGDQFNSKGLVTRNGDENAYRLQINNVTVEHQGNYTCKVQSKETSKEDSFFLNVVSDSPQCITRCNGYENTRQLVCYSRRLQMLNLSEQYFRLEESQNESSSMKAISDFSPFHFGNISVAPLNVNHQDTSKTYKCSVLRTGNSKNYKRSCLFDCTKHNDVCLNVICPPIPLTIGSHITTTFLNTEQIVNSLPVTLNSVSVGRISTEFDDETTELQTLLIGLLTLCCILILVLIFSCILVCCVLRKYSSRPRGGQSTVKAGVGTDQIGFQPGKPLSFVIPERSKNVDKQAIPMAEYCPEHKQNVIETNSFYNDPDKLKTTNTRVNGNCQNLIHSTSRPYEYIDIDIVPAHENKNGPSSMMSIGDVAESKVDYVEGSCSTNLDQTCGMIDNIVYEHCSDAK